MDKRIYPHTVKFNQKENDFIHQLIELGLTENLSGYIHSLVQKDIKERKNQFKQLAKLFNQNEV